MTGKALNVQFNLGAVDPNFGDANKLTRAMRAQDREDWPHGKSFAAIPHLNNKLGEEFVLSQTDSLICYQTQWMKDMVRKAGDPNDHEVLPWAPSDVTYGLIRTNPGGEKWYTMISWFINIRLGSAHPGFITHEGVGPGLLPTTFQSDDTS